MNAINSRDKWNNNKCQKTTIININSTKYIQKVSDSKKHISIYFCQITYEIVYMIMIKLLYFKMIE